MTLGDAKKIIREMIHAKGNSEITTLSVNHPVYLSDPEAEALQTALDFIDEGLPGRTVHELELGWNFCDPVLSGRKTFELRKNDRGFQTGDLIRFVPVRFEASVLSERFPSHPIQNKLYEITYILNGWGMTPDCVALAIKEVEK